MEDRNRTLGGDLKTMFAGEETPVLLGRGARRSCFEVPGKPLCVKCYHLPGEYPEPLHPSVRREIEKWRHSRTKNTNCQEYDYWVKLKASLPSDLFAVFPEHMELVCLDDRGWALVETRFRNRDGSDLKPILEELAVLEDRALKGRLVAAFESLCVRLAEHAVKFYDPPNVLVEWMSEDSFRLRIADFEPANRVLIPLFTNSRFYIRLRVLRRARRYAKLLHHFLGPEDVAWLERFKEVHLDDARLLGRCSASMRLALTKVQRIVHRCLRAVRRMLFPHNYWRGNKVYGRIYHPHYNKNSPLPNDGPEIYNKEGRRMETFFLRDRHRSLEPYDPPSKYFLWDRFNIGLDTHFYSHEAMLETMGSPKRRYGWLMESEEVAPRDYEIFDRHPTLHQDFDAVFTYSERLLEKLPNARFFPCQSAPWYGGKYGGTICDTAHQNKTRNVSILSSARHKCRLHHVRLAMANKCKRLGLADTFGTFDGGPYVKNGDTMEKYRYSIVIENSFSPLFFTERITSCFAAQTVPIYIGTPKIGRFFNADGIIQISERDVDDLERILSQCGEKDYLSRLPAILDNYQRVQPYFRIGDWLYEKYFL